MPEHYEIHHHKSNNLRWIMFSAFLAILVFLIITAFSDNFSFTGNLVNGIKQQSNSTIKFNAELTTPSMDAGGNFEKVEFQGNSESFFYVGNEKFQLNAKNNYIVMNNYTGAIAFDSQNIVKLNGKATKVFINGIPVEPKTNDILKVSLDKDFSYTSLSIENEIKISKLSYITTGEIRINGGKKIFTLDNEQISLKNFIGDVSAENNKFKMSGLIEKLDIAGETKISLS